MKNVVNLNQVSSGGVTYLNQGNFTTEDTIYLINSDYVLGGSIYLPCNSEIRIETGSISGVVGENGENWIFLPYKEQSYQKLNQNLYKIMAVSASDGKLIRGTVIRSFDNYSYYFELYGKARIALPQYGKDYNKARLGEIIVKSNHNSIIEIDGKTELGFYAERCNFLRIYDKRIYDKSEVVGFHFINRLDNYDLNITFENCIIRGGECNCTEDMDYFMPLKVSTNKQGRARLIVRDCEFTNIGIAGEVYVDNCKFVYGENVNNNNETIHCASHSRILNSIFDGNNTNNLNNDVIDCFNGHDIVIDNCTFVNYANYGETLNKGANIITIKSHYSSNDTNQPMDSHLIGQQTGVTVSKCFFDLPKFNRSIITVWNGLRNDSKDTENRQYNRQFTNIESNFVKAPSAIFVNCLAYADSVRINNNSGQASILVLVRDEDKRRAHNIEICDNLLVFNGTDGATGMTILSGSCIDNLTLTGNRTYGYLWQFFNNSNIVNLSGTIRVTNNETTGPRGLFQNSDSKGIVKIPYADSDAINFYFSGNVSSDKKTDVGSMSLANSPTAGVLFVGRQFFCIDDKKLKVYDGTNWQSI